jgi:hypothetical protein
MNPQDIKSTQSVAVYDMQIAEDFSEHGSCQLKISAYKLQRSWFEKHTKIIFKYCTHTLFINGLI